MTINCSDNNLKRFNGVRKYLTLQKRINNGNNPKEPLVSHNEALDYILSNLPITEEVDKIVKHEEESDKSLIGTIDLKK